MKRKKVRDARDSLKAIRLSAIADIVVGIIVLVGLALIVGMVLGAEAAVGPVDEEFRRLGQIGVVVVAGVGVTQLGGGIHLLRCHSSISEVFREAFPDEDDD